MTSIDWLEVRLQGRAEVAAHAEVLLQEQGFPGWVDEGASAVLQDAADFGPPHVVSETRDGFLYLVYLAQQPGWPDRLAQLQQSCQAWEIQVSSHGQVRDEDWAENWKQFYHPLPVGKSLVVCPSWETYSAEPGQRVMVLDPGSAFGTGYHWSTRLCLEFLEQVAPLEPMLDLGTGSGILAIGAHLLGVRDILAVDNDPVAVQVARVNLNLNQAGDVRVEKADRPPAGPFRLITANLVASLLIGFADALYAALEPQGVLICGGIIQERKEEVIGALVAAGLDLREVKQQEDWVSLLLVRP